jgi:Flp pilus assembly protein TadG
MRRALSRADDGALTLSYVIIVPVFLAGLMVIVQASVWYLARQAALAAARQGVDAARVLGSAPGAGPRTAVAFARSAASGFLLRPRAYALNQNATTQGTIQVTVTGTVPSLVPGLALTVTQVAAGPVEKFTTA